MAEITVRDLLSWESRIGLGSDGGNGPNGQLDETSLDREMTWAVTLRASMPILPVLRGGEMVILPDRILLDAGVPIDEIVREVASRGATGLIVERSVHAPASLVIIRTGVIPPDLESDINRMLTEQRGEIYRVGTELGRVLTQLNAAGSDIGQVLRSTSEQVGVGAAVVSGRDGMLGAHGSRIEELAPGLPVPAGGRGWQAGCYGVSLANGATLWLGPMPPERRAMARLVSERVGMAVEAALAHALDVRPRGSARAHALAGLLTGATSEAARVGSALGLPSHGSYLIALAPASIHRVAMQRQLAGVGLVHDAGEVDGCAAALIEAPDRPVRSPRGNQARVMDRRSATAASENSDSWIALSETVTGVARVPAAARQARYLAALISAGMLPGSVVRYDRPADVGVYRLLFPLWGTGELEGYARDTLGDLVSRDKRGTLRRTLLAYLESGGSQVDAATSLGVHRNTLAYRLRQIAELTGTDPTKPQSHLALHMALLASVLPPAPGN
ncbi:PucR family transcriptional regulator [soil metagenome]